ncbi:TPA: hypothetical protein ACG0MY_000104 [Serratia marcescens]|uniref:hypothetical protein n=1 Tax=Serratia ureilytica TaxID=300181 RepID=UPI001E3B076C|nr:hypothetical protein [Serratia ureilytica]
MALLGFFSLLLLQDYVFIVGALISAFFTSKTYYAKRKEERERLAEERRRHPSKSSCYPLNQCLLHASIHSCKLIPGAIRWATR